MCGGGGEVGPQVNGFRVISDQDPMTHLLPREGNRDAADGFVLHQLVRLKVFRDVLHGHHHVHGSRRSLHGRRHWHCGRSGVGDVHSVQQVHGLAGKSRRRLELFTL